MVFGSFISTTHRKEPERRTIRLLVNLAAGVLELSSTQYENLKECD